MATDTTRLRALLEAATPRPWRTSGNGIAVEEAGWDIEIANCKALGKSYDDAKLIAEAVNAIPGLIAENERLRAALDEVERKYQQWLCDDSQSRDVLVSIAATVETAMCSDCPPVGYSTDETRCSECPRSKEGRAK